MPALESYQREFFNLAIDHGALKFGEFTLKSGRLSPYFLNTGAFSSGQSLARLAELYRQTIDNHIAPPFSLYGPAYKGIPLITAIALAFSNQGNLDIKITFDRKEAKDHGEGGVLIGARLTEPVIVVDDVITAGISIERALQLVKVNRGTVKAIVVAMDRQEHIHDQPYSAIQAVATRHRLPIFPIVTATDLLTYLRDKPEYRSVATALKTYLKQYS